MSEDHLFGSIDRYWVDPDTGSHILAGWAADAADPANRSLVVRFHENGAEIGCAVADIARDDGFHGFVARCDGIDLAARAAAKQITATVHAPDGREGNPIWHPPFLDALTQQAQNPAPAPAEPVLRPDDRVAPGAVDHVVMLPDGIEISTGAVHLRITAPREDILRVRMAASTDWPDQISWTVLDSARDGAAPIRALQDADAVGFATTRLIVRVLRATGRVLIARADGTPVCHDAADFPAELQQGGFTLRKQRLPGERYFGLGDQPGPLDRTGHAFVLWNSDTGNYQESTTPMYKSVPFYIAARPGSACGILLDNSWRSSFDFGQARRDVIAFGAEGGPAEYYVLPGADARAVLQSYAHLTGLPPLPPRWALGYHQSRYSYISQQAVMDVAEELRSRNFPVDAIHCDIDFQDKNRPFTINKKTFPDFKGMAHDLATQDVRIVAITDLHIAQATTGYAPYTSGLAGKHFVTTPAGEPYIGDSHPGPAAFPDFTRADTRQWWGGLYRELIDAGVAGFWNDMNEPAVSSAPSGTMPLDTVHKVAGERHYPDSSATHAELHNIVGLQNVRATYDGVLALRPDERPFVLTRANFAGGQRYAWTWTGDNSATWNHLRLTTPMLVNSGLSGLAFTGADVGGFFGSASPDLLTRWFQLGAFQPFFRNHCFQESAPREPWLDGPDHEAIRRRFVEERYRLLPYLYTLAEETARTGVPMLRPLFFECPTLLGAANNFRHAPDAHFLVGPALMVAPQPFPDTLNAYDVALPDGPWFDYWTGRVVNGAITAIEPSLDHLPVFVRAGSILPRQPLVQSTDETPDGPLELSVYPGRVGNGSIYLDDGHSLAYQRGVYLRQNYRFTTDADGSEFTLSDRAGSYHPWWDTIEIVLHSVPNRPVDVTATNGTILSVRYDVPRAALRIVLSDAGGADVVRVTPKR
jgi:alpha-glucosidase